MHSITSSPKHAYRNKTTNIHSPKILGNLCASCLGSRKGDSRGSRKIPRKTPGRLPIHTMHNKHFAIQKYDVHEMHSKLSKLCMAWQFARNKLSQASQTNLEIILRQE